MTVLHVVEGLVVDCIGPTVLVQGFTVLITLVWVGIGLLHLLELSFS